MNFNKFGHTYLLCAFSDSIANLFSAKAVLADHNGPNTVGGCHLIISEAIRKTLTKVKKSPGKLMGKGRGCSGSVKKCQEMQSKPTGLTILVSGMPKVEIFGRK